MINFEKYQKLLNQRKKYNLQRSKKIYEQAGIDAKEEISDINSKIRKANQDIRNINSNTINSELKKASNMVYREYQKNGYENVALYNPKENKIIGGINNIKNVSKVDYSDLQYKILKEHTNELYSIHTHPTENIPSIEDLYDVFKQKGLCGIIVSTEKYNYYFEPKLNQINDVSEHLDEFSMWLEKRLATLSDKNFGKYNNLNEEWFVSYKEIFEKLGWKYGRERK